MVPLCSQQVPVLKAVGLLRRGLGAIFGGLSVLGPIRARQVDKPPMSFCLKLSTGLCVDGMVPVGLWGMQIPRAKVLFTNFSSVLGVHKAH